MVPPLALLRVSGETVSQFGSRRRSPAPPAAALAPWGQELMILNASAASTRSPPGDVARRALARRLRDEDGHAAARGGNESGPDRRDRARMLNSIGSPTRIDVSPPSTSRAAELGVPSGSSGASRPTTTPGSCDVLDDGTRSRSRAKPPCPNVEDAAAPRPRSSPRAGRASGSRSTPSSRRVFGRGCVAVAVAEAGADGLSLVNTIRGLALDERTLRRGWRRSRAATRPGAEGDRARCRPACHAATGLPSSHVRSPTGRDALELIAAGATHVALGTVLFSDPDAPAASRRAGRRSRALGSPTLPTHTLSHTGCLLDTRSSGSKYHSPRLEKHLDFGQKRPG